MKICVVGLGYIGLPTASLLATKGYDVLGVDIREDVVETINRGEIHITEPELDILVKSAVNSGKLSASLTAEPADVFILATPTPFKANREPELAYVEAAARAVAPVLKSGSLVILESTVPVGTTEHVSRLLAEQRPDLQFPRGAKLSENGSNPANVFVAHCPERVLPGRILKELVENDRIIGGIDGDSTEKATAFYRSFVSGSILQTHARTAELAKLTENSYRDVNIAFANELDQICEHLDIDVWEVIRLANHHPRVNILSPGPGVGGHCIAVDPWFIVHSAPEQSRLIRTAREVNDGKPHHLVKKIRERAARLKEPRIACLGLSYKANVDDLRESPAVEITRELSLDSSLRLLVVEPHVSRLPQELQSANVTLTTLEDALRDSDIVVLLVDHRAFSTVPRAVLAERIVFDTRGLWRKAP